MTVWSPAGRLHQVEYAMEAVKQGSATVGLKSATHAVVVALKRAASDLAAHQKKIIPVDEHMGVSISGKGFQVLVVLVFYGFYFLSSG